MTIRSFRRLNHLWAYLLGYFWIACPACGRMFGGHEAGDAVLGGRMCCWRHDAAAYDPLARTSVVYREDGMPIDARGRERPDMLAMPVVYPEDNE